MAITQEEFIELARTNNQYSDVVGEYAGLKKPILCRCRVCGELYTAQAERVAKGVMHNKCKSVKIAATRLKDLEHVQERVNKVLPNIEVLDDYRENDDANKRRLKCKCKVCGHIWTPLKHHVYDGHGCPNCYNKGKVTNDEIFRQRMSEIHPDIELLSDYSGYHDKVKLRCIHDGYEWYAEPSKLLRGNKTGCPLCGGHLKVTYDAFQKRVKSKNPAIIFTSDFKSIKEPIECSCSVCNHQWKTNAGVLLYGNAFCPNCKGKRSKGEAAIFEYLRSRNIYFEEQKTFDGCADKHKLPFDFYIPSLNTCVEFDGPQHFQETPHFCHQIDRDPKDQLEYVQMHDEMKNQYCDNAGINLIRIKYTQIDEVEDILDRKLIRTRNEEAS